jgi:hypothetical protein
MTNTAYLLFTFLACLAGLSIGLVVHHVWRKASALVGREKDPFAGKSTDDSRTWDAYAQWQSDNNRRFATQVFSCGAAPIVFAGIAWTERSDIVKSVCGAVTQAVGQAYICM